MEGETKHKSREIRSANTLIKETMKRQGIPLSRILSPSYILTSLEKVALAIQSPQNWSQLNGNSHPFGVSKCTKMHTRGLPLLMPSCECNLKM